MIVLGIDPGCRISGFAVIKRAAHVCTAGCRDQKPRALKKQSVAGRISAQLSCAIEPEDKELLNKLALYACNRENKLLKTSIIVLAFIRLGSKYKDELIF